MTEPDRQAYNLFEKSLLTSLTLVLLVMVAGATVRATGAGMGCPDWPLCYGLVVPPVAESQLPADYQTRYAVGGHPAEFNAVLTWIEYINRLLGLVSGLAVVVQLALAIWLMRRRRLFFWLSLAALFLIGFEAWLGAKVVGSYLDPLAVTLHLLGALAIVALYLVMLERLRRQRGDYQKDPVVRISPLLAGLWIAVVVATLSQAYLGIVLRESLEADLWKDSLDQAHRWMAELGGNYLLHRTTGLFLGSLALLMAVVVIRQRSGLGSAWYWPLITTGLIGLEGAIGLILHFFGLPAWSKPLHLLGATLIFGSQVWFYLRMRPGFFWPRRLN